VGEGVEVGGRRRRSHGCGCGDGGGWLAARLGIEDGLLR